MEEYVKWNRPYFIAEIGGNHDGSLDRALELIALASKSGATAVKFQNFTSSSLINFEPYIEHALKNSPHKKSAEEIRATIEKLSVPKSWFPELKRQSSIMGVDLITAPYELEQINFLAEYVDAFKIGSGDLNWHEKTKVLAGTGKPLILSTGASTIDEIEAAVSYAQSAASLAVLHCVSNYDGKDYFFNSNVNLIPEYKSKFPGAYVGLSDHQKSNLPVLCAIASGGTVIERHFTDDPNRDGADHRVALSPMQWSLMVDEANACFVIMGSKNKQITSIENGTRISQRRSLWYARSMLSGEVIERKDLQVLRPAMQGGYNASEIASVIGKKLAVCVKESDLICPEHFKQQA